MRELGCLGGCMVGADEYGEGGWGMLLEFFSFSSIANRSLSSNLITSRKIRTRSSLL